jgi:hypothetical protein
VGESERLCYAALVFGMNSGEWSIVAFLLVTIFVAPWSGRAGEYVASWFVSKDARAKAQASRESRS